MPEIIITTHDNATGAQVTLPTDPDAAANRLADGTVHTRWRCSADGTPVSAGVVGTSEYAGCQRGHRWEQTFGPAGWREVR